MYASDDENECHLWVMAMYRATGQSHKPTPPVSVADKNSTISKIQGDADRARKHGMEDFISADPCKFDHAALFKMLQNLTLDYRLNDPYSSLGWFSPGQVFVLDEYCARYVLRVRSFRNKDKRFIYVEIGVQELGTLFLKKQSIGEILSLKIVRSVTVFEKAFFLISHELFV